MIGFISLAVVLIICTTRIIFAAIALRGVPAEHRAEVLRSVAECFRSWRKPARQIRGLTDPKA